MIRIIYICVIAIIVTACGNDSDIIFKKHAYNGEMANISNVNYGKVTCMHCPLFFKFEANSIAIEKIIKDHSLVMVREKLDTVERLNKLISHQSQWWTPKLKGSDVQILGAFYQGRDNIYEPAFRILIVNDETLYFVTSGHFMKDHYTNEKA